MAIGTVNNAAPTQSARPTAPRADAASPAQLASQRADQALGPKVTTAPVTTTAPTPAPEGSNVLRDKMVQAGMKDVATPPSDANMRTWYSQHAAHHDLIGKGDYKAAAAAYDKDFQAAIERGDQKTANELRATKTQLEFAAKMKDAAGPNGQVSFPPSHEEAKAHFRGLKGQDATAVGKEFTAYSKAFYIHAGNDQETLDKGIKDVKYTPHKVAGLKDPSTAPVGTADIRDNRGLNKNGQRVIDCEGYVELGKDLLGEAGFKQPAGGGVHRVSNSKNPGATGHVMLEMSDAQGKRLIVDNENIHTSDRAAYARPGGTPLWRALGMPQEDMQVYRGPGLDEATVNQVQKRNKYSPKIDG